MRPQSSESQKIERKNFELKNFFLTERMLPILIFIVLCLLIGTFNSSFFLYQTWQNIFMQVANIGIIALGAMFVITSGGLDFTSGNV